MNPKQSLEGKTALVTAASRGIGRAIALALADAGVSVIVNYHQNLQAAEEVVNAISKAGGRAWAVRGDVARKPDVESMFAQVQQHVGDRLDILVNNAGGPAKRFPLATMPEEAWDRCMEVNLKGAFLCTQAAWNRLPNQSGRVINITSISARTGGGPGMGHYAAAKAAVSNFTRACAKEFAPRSITVNGIAPGVIYTDLHKFGTPQEELETLKPKIPLQRFGQSDEVADAAVFLCGPKAAYITGEIIEINGGLLMS